MNLYHGSLGIVKYPEIRQPSRTLDYGNGFVNVYEFDPEALGLCKSLVFNEPTEEWVDFVMKNRTQIGFTHDYDIVYGPVANDRVYAAFALFEGGVLNKQELIRELKTYRLVDQYLFHTEAALGFLTFVDGKEIAL